MLYNSNPFIPDPVIGCRVIQTPYHLKLILAVGQKVFGNGFGIAGILRTLIAYKCDPVFPDGKDAE